MTELLFHTSFVVEYSSSSGGSGVQVMMMMMWCLFCFRELMEEKTFFDLTTSEERCVIHFCHPDFRRCAILDTHLEVRCPAFWGSAFMFGDDVFTLQVQLSRTHA